MRATVGPLSPAVYWRRRAVVLGAVLLGVIVLFMSCTGEDKKDPQNKSASSQYPTPAPNTDSASPEPTFLNGSEPAVGPALPDPADLLTQQPGDSDELLPTGNAGPTGNAAPTLAPTAALTTPPAAPAGPGDGGACADAEMSVTPVPVKTEVKRGVPLDLRLKIKNIGTRTCTRDVGADAQELYIDLGPQKVWSSDKCSTVKGSDVRAFAPGAEREYQVTWNGRQSSQCANNLPSGPIPSAGQYELRGRLGELVSTPVVVTVVA
ncbi:adhesin [Actinoplanes sp. DH11]|uniref:adhesin n=1 Tax=Actinoplanes sp. DH11 TaxID=2857011 RepID=UPI001E551664|nr:adhesin [Actinoplanes sp. DH11]